MGVENLTHTGIRAPDCAARGKSLYHLSYFSPQTLIIAQVEQKCNDKYKTVVLITTWKERNHIISCDMIVVCVYTFD
jgi:hypothetical protein